MSDTSEITARPTLREVIADARAEVDAMTDAEVTSARNTGLLDGRLRSEIAAPDNCACHSCRPNAQFMVLCPDCGNKRCPKAAHHDRQCTGSNEPGQPGSAYP